MEHFDSNVLTIIIIILVVMFLISLPFMIFSILGLWKIYKKAGKQGWEAIVPFYNYWVLVEIAGLNWWWFLLIISSSIFSFIGFEELYGLIGLVSCFALFNCYYNISKKFNKGVGFAIGLTFLLPIFAPILGLSKNNTYDNSVMVSKDGVFGSSNSNTNNNQYGYTEQVNGTTADACFCGNCGTKLSRDIRFCPNCGKENR